MAASGASGGRFGGGLDGASCCSGGSGGGGGTSGLDSGVGGGGGARPFNGKAGGGGGGGGGGELPFKDKTGRRDVTEATHGRGPLFAAQASALDPDVIKAAGGLGAFVPRLGPDATGADNLLWRCLGNCKGCITAAEKQPGGPGCINKTRGNYLDRAVCGANKWCTCKRPFEYSRAFGNKRRK
jgi:hypothetical protein